MEQTARSSDLVLDRVLVASWPAAVVQRVGDWRCRFTGGFTRRANSAAIMSEHVEADARRITAVEHFYEQRGMPARFQVNLTPRMEELRLALERRGYHARSRTHVLVTQLAEAEAEAGRAPGRGVELLDQPDDEWLRAWAEVEVRVSAHPDDARGLLDRIPAPRAFAKARDAEETCAGVAVGCVVQGWLAVAAVATLPNHRGQGHGGLIQEALQDWAARNGARRAVLQVEAANSKALRLYERAGFVPSHTYCYYERER